MKKLIIVLSLISACFLATGCANKCGCTEQPVYKDGGKG